jgi:hypothetical protein
MKNTPDHNQQSNSEAAIPVPAPTFEQQLAFLQYLVKRGILNEGFPEGQIPKQYRRKM